MLSLHNLKASPKSTHRRKVVGRGSGSGHGNYSTRGMKGQRARSGGKSGLVAKGMRTYLMRIPKSRGFRSMYAKMAVVNVGWLDKNFSAGQTINIRALLQKGLVATTQSPLKVLSTGELTKKLIVEADAFSAAAKAKIEAAGGQAKLIVRKKEVKDKAAK